MSRSIPGSYRQIALIECFHLHRSSAPVTLPELPQAIPTHSTTETRKKNLPSFCFSKSELFTLARFEDQETADQVLHWLGLQGKLAE